MLKGRATPEGTLAYKARFEGKLAEGHFRQKEGLYFSSIGIGSYLGETDEATDRLYEDALKEALLSGINVMDSAINYRAQRSERCFGQALSSLCSHEKIKRQEVIVCTKGGFVPFDGSRPRDPVTYFKQTYIHTGILKPHDLVEGCHAMTPEYLEDQLQKSLVNLNLETLDIYYLHNPEIQLVEVERKEFLSRMRKAFEWLEQKVGEGKIQMYGTATWNGYRVLPEDGSYLSLEELNLLAREVAGPKHHFKVVQLPFNLGMPEAWIAANQRFGANNVSFLFAAERLGIITMGSASLLQARLTGSLPESFSRHFKNLGRPSQRALQFARSVPGMTTSLVGMKNKNHVRENLETAKVPPLTEQELLLMFQQE